MGMYGWADAHRDDDDFARQYAEQTELLEAQLAGMRAGPPGRRRKFRALEYVCSRCGDTTLEVMRTSPYWTLITWPTEPSLDNEHGPELRRGQRQFLPLSDPLPDPDTVRNYNVPTSCRCQARTLGMDWIVRDLNAGTAKRTLPGGSRED